MAAEIVAVEPCHVYEVKPEDIMDDEQVLETMQYKWKAGQVLDKL